MEVSRCGLEVRGLPFHNQGDGGGGGGDSGFLPRNKILQNKSKKLIYVGIKLQFFIYYQSVHLLYHRTRMIFISYCTPIVFWD